MKDKAGPLAPVLHNLALMGVVVVLYFLTAQLGLLWSLPPDDISPLWPPAGLALAGVLLFGWQAAAGVWIGAFLVNLQTLSGPGALPVAAVAAAGSTFEAWLAAWLLRRLIPTLPPDNIRHTLHALGITSLTTLPAPLIGVTALCIGGFATWSSFAWVFWTWWLGDFTGILILAPLLMVLILHWHGQKMKEPYIWPLTSLIVGLALLAFFVIQTYEKQGVRAAAEGDFLEITHVLQDMIDHQDIQSLASVSSLFGASQDVTREEFAAFLAPVLKDYSPALGISWAPRVAQADRQAFEQLVREQGFEDYLIYEIDANGKKVPAAERPEYFPVTYIQPLEANRAVMGFDNASSKERLEAADQARDSGEAVASDPVTLVQYAGQQKGILVMVPVYRTGAQVNTIAERRANLRGFVVGAFQVEGLIREAMQGIAPYDIELYIYDLSKPGSPQFLFFYPSISGPQTLPEGGIPTAETLQSGDYHTARIKVGGRDWLLAAQPGPAYATSNAWVSWAGLLIGLALAGIFLVYVNNRQKGEAALAHSEAEFRALADSALTGVMRLRLPGEILYANESLAQIFGFSAPEDFCRMDLRKLIADGTQFEAFSQALLSTHQVRNQEMEVLTVQGDKRHVLCSAVEHDGLVSVTIVDITDRKLASELARKAQSNLETAQAVAHLGSWELNLSAGMDFWSKEMYHLFRCDPDQGVPALEKFMELVHPDDRQPLLDAHQHAMETGALVTMEYRSNPAWEAGRYFQATIQTTKGEDGRVAFMSGTVLEITEIKRADEQLRESESRLKQAQQISRLGSWELDLIKNELKWSDEIYRIFGLEPQEFAATYEAFLDAIHPDDREMVNLAYTNSLVTRTPYEIVHRLKLKDGVVKYVQEKCETYFDENGVPLRSLGTVQDISERRQMELDIRERVKELTCLFEVSRLLENHSASLAILCDQIIKNLIPAMQFPWFTAPVIELDGNRYTSELYEADLTHCLQAVIDVNGEKRGQLSVYYTRDEPFILPEEQKLVDNVALMLGMWYERRQSETALRESEERFRKLADNIQEVFWMEDVINQQIVYVSPAYEIIWGRSIKSLNESPHDYFESIVLEDRPRMLEIIDAQQRGERTEVEYRVQRPDGSVRWVWDRSFPIFDEMGKLVRNAGVATDITELKNAQRQLEDLNRDLARRVEEQTAEVRQSEATYRALFENSNDGIFLMTPEGEDLLANQQALDMLGYTSEEYLDLNRVEQNAIALPEQKPDAEARFKAVLAGEHLSPYDRVFIAKDGKKIDVEINLSAVRDASGNIILVQSVVRDITERKKAEQILRESRDRLSAANAALERASRMKDEFLASMSHELRTPLTGILGLSEALQLQTYGQLNEKQLKALRNIENSGRHLLDLINDILDLSKIEAGKLDLQFETCAVSDICQASLQLVKGMAQHKKQHTSFSMDPASINVRADPRRLKQMLVNLLSNAVKFTPDGGSLGLEVQGNEEEKVVLFIVWDKGIGIKPEELGKLFKPFVQLDSSLARQYSGTGLGLSLVSRMAQLHGGSIKVESVPGEGSRFTIAIPWNEDATRLEPAVTTPAQADLTERSLKNSLVIEDNDLDAEHVSRYLKEIGLASVVHPGMSGALEKAALLHPSVILLDLRLPDGSGLELLPLLRKDERTRNIPVVITSVEERRSEAQQLGAVGYLVKPFTLQDLRSELSKAAASTRSTDPVMVIGSRPAVPLVLLADDNEVILETVADFLETRGCRVVATRSGFELLERAPELHPDVILVDIQMPGMDGLETMRRLRAHHDPLIASVPIVAITALAMTGDREKCLEAGANEYISKPIILTQLAKTIDRFLEEKI
jgi:PAS domain S-box-containing protein